MKKMMILLCAMVLLAPVGLSPAGDPQYTQEENAQLKRRLERLENALEDLKKANAAPGKPAAATGADPSGRAAKSNSTSTATGPPRTRPPFKCGWLI